MKYKLGDWMRDIHTGDVYEIIKRTADWFTLKKKIDGANADCWLYGTDKRSVNTDSLKIYFVPAKSAQILYQKKII